MAKVIGLDNGTATLDTQTAGNAAQQTVADIIIAMPEANATQTIELEGGKTYALGFNQNEITDVKVENGDVIISLKNGGTIILDENEIPLANGDVSLLFADGSAVTMELLLALAVDIPNENGESDGDAVVVNEEAPSEENLADAPSAEEEASFKTAEALAQNAEEELAEATTDELNAAAEKLAQVEPAAGENIDALAAQLAQVEPAAGPAGAAGRGGSGFNSSVANINITQLNAIGPIDPTALQYGIPSFEQEVFLSNQPATRSAPPPFLPPVLTTSFSSFINADNALVKEDGSVDVTINATQSGPAGAIAGNEVLTVTISGVDPSWGFTPSPQGGANWTPTGNPGEYSITLPAGDDLINNVITFTPPANSDVDLNGLVVTASVYDPDLNQTRTATDGFNIVTDAVADKPVINALDDNGVENTQLDVDVTAMLNIDVDGSETITHYQISGVPAGFSFSAGTDLGGGVWEFTPAEIVGLKANPPIDFVGSINLTATVFNAETNLSGVEVDTGDNTNSASDPFTLTWVDDLNPPKITKGFSNFVDADNALVKEDGSVDVTLTVKQDGPAGAIAGNEVLTVTISGVDPSWGFTATGQSGANWTPTGNPGEYSITLPAGEDLSSVLTFSPPANSDVDLNGLVVTASVYDPDLNKSASDTDGFNIITDAVADQPDINALDDSGVENTALDVVINGIASGDTDGSESITHYEISGVPAGFSFSAGTNLGGGVWEFTPAEIVGLKITAPINFTGSINLTAKVYNEETVLSDVEVDIADNVATDTDGLTLTWFDDLDPPKITKGFSNFVDADNALVKEDGSVDVTLNVAQSGPAGAIAGNEVLTVTISGVDPSWGFNPSSQGGANWTPTGTPGEYSITLPAGQDLVDNVLTFSPPADSDFDLNGLVVTATVYDPDLNKSAEATDGFNIVTDAVADQPTLTANAASGEEGTTIPLNITTAPTDTDGSESLQPVVISGVPSGATLTAGTQTAPGVWSVPVANLPGLGINVPNGTLGTFNLTVTSTAEEVQLNGVEVDLTDNTASATKTLVLTVTPDDEPIIAQPSGVTVDETGLETALVIANGTVNVDYGSDTGSVVPTGASTFVAGGSLQNGNLTSNNVPVVVTLVGTTYTGKAGATTVFTLNVNPDGSYTFTQFEELDHNNPSNPNDIITLEFGVTANDSDGDSATGKITVNVADDAAIANDDFNQFDSNAGSTNGNVITGVNGGAGAADNLSVDVPNTVTKISFGGNTVNVPTAGTATINGDYGVLQIAADGSYTYTLNAAPTPTTSLLNPTASDVAGTQNSITKNGITVKGPNGQDLSWVTQDGAGIGTNAGKVFGANDFLDVSFASPANKIIFTIADIGANNLNGHLDFVITFDGVATPVTYVFDISSTTPSGGLITVEIDAADFPQGSEITSVKILPTGTSYLLNNVQTQSGGLQDTCDEFVYTLADGDGDTDTAVLKLKSTDLIDDVPVVTSPGTKTVDESDLPNDTVSGKVTVDYGSDAPGSVTPGTLTNSSTTLTSDGFPVTVSTSGTVITGKANGQTIFTLDVQPNGDYVFKLVGTLDHPNASNPDDVINLTFSVTATDFDGDTAPGVININVKDDAPVAVDDTKSVSESVGSASGNVIANDSLSEDDPNTVTKVSFGGNTVNVPTSGTATINGQYGTLTIKADGSYTYTITATNPPAASEKFTYTLTDFDGDSDTADLTLNLSVVDDQPIVTNPAIKTVDESDLPNDTVSGNISVNYGSDTAAPIVLNGLSSSSIPLKSDGTPVTLTQVGNTITGSANGNQIFTLTVQPNGAYTFRLTGTLDHPNPNNPDEAIRLNFGFTASDTDGDSATGLIRIDVKDDAPVAVDDTKSVSESVGSASGNVIANDSLSEDDPNTVTKVSFGGNTVNVPASGTATINGQYGTLTIKADGSYTYTITATNPPAASEKFTYTLTDFDGDSDTADLTLNLSVVDDQPDARNDKHVFNSATTGGDVITGLNGGPGSADYLSTDGGNRISQVRFETTTKTIPSGGSTTIQGKYGQLTLNADGTYVYKVDNSVLNANNDKTISFDPTAADFDGNASIQITSASSGNLIWRTWDIVGDPGIGISGGPSNSSKVYGEKIRIAFLEGPIDSGSIDISDIGPNNYNDTIKITAYLEDGSTVTRDYSVGSPASGNATINFDNDDFGTTQLITKILVESNLTGGTGTGESYALNPVAGDVAGTQTSFTKNNITITSVDGRDLLWRTWDILGSPGIGVEGGPSNTSKLFGETLRIQFNGDVETAKITISDIAPNDHGENISFRAVFADGTTKTIVLNVGNPSSGNQVFELDAGDFGVAEGTLFKSIDVFDGAYADTDPSWLLVNVETTAPNNSGPSFLLTGVTGNIPGDPEIVTDVFTYTLRDVDGDSDTATLTLTYDPTGKGPYNSPLVLDLDGDGVELASMAEGVRFDINADGEIDQTGWVGKDDGLLALDRNGDGLINDGSELFGDNVTDGFTALRALDSNGDGVIDAKDAQFADLKVWQDANTDGVSQADELKSLSELNIESISLASDETATFNAGNIISHEGTYTTADGETHEIVDAWFAFEAAAAPADNATEGDLLSGSDEADLFLFQSISEGVETIHALQDGTEADLDVTSVLEDYDSVTEAIAAFVDQTGTGEGSFVGEASAELQNVASQLAALDISIEQILQDGQITH